jgi:nucleotide-binding universal stress UspA family protein
LASTISDRGELVTRVLVALDGLPESVRAARAAVDLFGAEQEYLIVNVAPGARTWDDDVAFGVVIPMSDVEWETVTDAVDDAAQSKAKTGAVDAGIEPAEIIVEHGDPVAAICGAAESHDADVIVIGSHDRGRLKRMLTPSIADGVVHTTSRPVLVVSGGRHGEEEQ